MRIASLNEVPQTALTELDQLVEKTGECCCAGAPAARRRRAQRRQHLERQEREKLSEEMGKIEKADGEMHQQIKDLLFVFDNLLDVDDRGIQALLREVVPIPWRWPARAEPEVQRKC